MANLWLQLKNMLARMVTIRVAGPRFFDPRLVMIASGASLESDSAGATTSGGNLGAGVCFNQEPFGSGAA